MLFYDMKKSCHLLNGIVHYKMQLHHLAPRLPCHTLVLSIEEHNFVLAQGELSYVLFVRYSKCKKIFFEMKQWIVVAQVQHFMLIAILRSRSKLELAFLSWIFYASLSIKFTIHSIKFQNDHLSSGESILEEHFCAWIALAPHSKY